MELPLGTIVCGEPSRPALRYRGGKWRAAPRIVAHFPPHETYVEPYMGAASVLLRKPRADFEVLNDLNGAVVNFFQVLREHPAELQRAIALTPFSRTEYQRCRKPCPERPVEWARRFWVQMYQGRGRADGANGGRRFQTSWNGWNADLVAQFREVEHFIEIADRLLGVQIEHGTALEVIDRWDKPHVLLYVDPPYPHETRPNSPKLYQNEMSDADHVNLLLRLRAFTGMVVLSSYPNALYAGALPDWRMETRADHAEAQKETVEAIWINPACDAALRAADKQMNLLEAR